MVPAHMAEILDEALYQSDTTGEALIKTKAIQDLINYVDNLEAELIVRRAADTPNAKVVTLKYAPKELDIVGSQGV
jgi:hypothetical protein